MTKKPNGLTYDEHRFEVITQDGGDGDIMIPIPPEVLARLGWSEGQPIDIQVSKDGKLIFTKGH